MISSLLLGAALLSAPVPNAGEAPVLQESLAAAAKFESLDAWEAATLYCAAARKGSIEAQYRLGMLYAFGEGVPENRKMAATLFSGAAQQGHMRAQNMLETIRLGASALPPCILADIKPEKAPEPPMPPFPELSANQQKIARIVRQIALWHDVDPQFALSIARVESQLNPQALSPKLAQGVMQLIPETAERFNVKDAFNASQNIKGGVRYLRWLLDRYQGNVVLVAASYNAGEKAVDRYRGVPPYAETQEYVAKVIKFYPYAQHKMKQRLISKAQMRPIL
ncbi:lytic transglycosylase domain-containing protein [Janthinobacterium sp. B9-8]|uniref:lytic transglycosylase domain-containing protein n=1 Tax=Janthinobacterium sp. B9-8 TaxID=1236179 RepID=UPI00061D224E|nr:transglycosylase SLT domain-containing protein [Janthinobacterium sp. B9-8]